MKRKPPSRGPASPTRGAGRHWGREPAPAPAGARCHRTSERPGRLPAKGLRMDGYSRFAGWRRERT